MGHAPEPDLTAPAAAPAPWRRAAALATDAVTVFFLLWALAVVQVLWFMNDLSESFAPAPWGEQFVVTLAYTMAFAVYEVVFLVGNEGRTPGKDLFGVRVVGADGNRLSRTACLRRTLAVAPLWMVPPLWLALVLVAATGLPALAQLGGRARSWPDLVAGTRTVRFVEERADDADDADDGRRGDREEAAPPTVFTLLVGRKNARRFAISRPQPARSHREPDAVPETEHVTDP